MDWKEIVRTVAPALGTVLGTPLIGTAVGVLANVLLGDPNATAADVEAAVLRGLTPADILAVKKADQAFALQMKEADIRIEEIDARDRGSAREREVKVGRAATIGIHILATIILGTFGYAVYWILSGDTALPEDPTKVLLVGTVIGYISSKADAVVNYFFGSSAGSKQKTEAMADALQNAAVTK